MPDIGRCNSLGVYPPVSFGNIAGGPQSEKNRININVMFGFEPARAEAGVANCAIVKPGSARIATCSDVQWGNYWPNASDVANRALVSLAGYARLGRSGTSACRGHGSTARP